MSMQIVEGIVIHGEQLGRRLGFPTANIAAESVEAEDGVYASEVELDGVIYRAMSNLGRRPSVGGASRLLESYLFDFDGDIYGKVIRVRLINRIRGEKRCGSIEELRQLIESDARMICNTK